MGGKEIEKTLNHRRKQRIHFMIPESRLVFGIAEPRSHLKPDEVFVRVIINGIPQTIMGNVLVTRNPCLHPGDVRVFKAVDQPKYHHLIDCLVFSTHEDLERAPAADLAGGDLDGDKFSVIFDKDLIPTKTFPSGDYAPVEKTKSQGPLRQLDLIHHFASYNNTQVAVIKGLYLQWTEAVGAASKESRELSELFASGVDGEAVKIPLHLRTPPWPNDSKRFILNILLERTKEQVAELMSEQGKISDAESLPGELLRAVIYDQTLLPQTISQFEVFCMVDHAIQAEIFSQEKAWICSYASIMQRSQSGIEWLAVASYSTK